MEVQLTDFENAAHSVFIVLLTRAIMNLGLNFYLPISKVSLDAGTVLTDRTNFGGDYQVDENMHRAHRRDAVNKEKFFFRKNLYSPAPGHACCDTTPPVPSPSSRPTSPSTLGGIPSVISQFIQANGGPTVDRPASPGCSSHTSSRPTSPELLEPFGPVEDEYAEFTINEIINGDGKEFPGLMGVVKVYLDTLDIDVATRKELDGSLDLIRRRADGSFLSFCSRGSI
jgi:glutamate--cysteine ligase catalytic subunit